MLWKMQTKESGLFELQISLFYVQIYEYLIEMLELLSTSSLTGFRENCKCVETLLFSRFANLRTFK
jgi:hypothetical protein